MTEMIEVLGWRSLTQRCADARLVLLSDHVAVSYTQYLIPVTRLSRNFHPASVLLPFESKTYIQQAFI